MWPTLNCLKSRLERSCSRNASASASVLNSGTRFIVARLLRVHIAGAYWADEVAPKSKRYEHCPAIYPACRNVAALGRCGVLQIRRNARLTFKKQPFDFLTGNTMLPTFRPVAVIPVEPSYFHQFIVDKCLHKYKTTWDCFRNRKGKRSSCHFIFHSYRLHNLE